MDTIKEKRAVCMEICVSVFCTWAMGGSPRHWGDSLVLTADDAIMLPLASQRASCPTCLGMAGRPTGRVLTTTEMWVICTCVCARASKSARAKHVGSLRIMAQMPAILNVCSRYLALFCVFLQARKKARGGVKRL